MLIPCHQDANIGIGGISFGGLAHDLMSDTMPGLRAGFMLETWCFQPVVEGGKVLEVVVVCGGFDDVHPGKREGNSHTMVVRADFLEPSVEQNSIGNILWNSIGHQPKFISNHIG